MKRTAIALCLTAAMMLGVAVPAGAQTLSPGSANFPPTPFRQNSAPIAFSFTNTSLAPVNSNVATENTYTSGSFFETNDCPLFVPAGGSCTISVVFSPYTVQPAAKSGTLHAGGATAPLTGTGYLPGSGGKKKCKKKGKKRAAVAKKKKCGKKKKK